MSAMLSLFLLFGDPGFFPPASSSLLSLLEDQPELERDLESQIGHANLFAVTDQFLHFFPKVWPRLFLQTLGRLHVQRLGFGPDARLLQLCLRALRQTGQELFQGGFGVDGHVLRDVPADRAVVLLLRGERVRVESGIVRVARVHHVVFQKGGARRGDLEGLVAASRRYDGVRRRDGGDDVLDHALRHAVRHAGDVELFGPRQGRLVQPGYVFRVVGVEGFPLPSLLPGYDVRPLDAVLRLAGDGGERAERHRGARGVHRQLAFDARREGGQDDTSLALEPFGATVDQRLEGLWVLHVHHVDERGVDPATRLDAVQAADDQLELHVVLLVLVLDLAVVGGDFDSRDAALDERSGNLGL